MKRLFSFLLCLILILPLIVSCGEDLPESTTASAGETAEETKDETPLPHVYDKLSWDKINAFPIANKDMSIQELRQLCVDFFRFSQTFAWSPDESFSIQGDGANKKVTKGTVYGGLPYMTGTGSVYRIMEFYDTETGLVDISEAAKNPRYFGNFCSWGACWGHARVINSAVYGLTEDMVPKNGFIPVGPYTIDKTLPNFKSGTDTASIVKANGEDIMFQSYAQLKLADAVVYYRSTAGHIMMISQEPVIEKNADGTINGEKSYVHVIEQVSDWKPGQKQSDGSSFTVQGNVDRQVSFAALLKSCYIPYTFAEFLGTDPIEETQCSVDLPAGSVSADELCKGTVNANYYISDVYIDILDKDGNVADTKVCRATYSGVRTIAISKSVFASALKKYTTGEYSVKITVQLGNGARPVIYEGSLTK